MRFAPAWMGPWLCSLAMTLHGADGLSERRRAAVWLPDVPGGDPALARSVAELVSRSRYDVRFLDSVSLTNVTSLNAGSFDLLVLPGARVLPVESIPAIKAFLEAGGNLLALGLTAWETPTFRLGGRWTSQAEYDQTLAGVKPGHPLIDFAAEDLTRWTRHSNRGGGGGGASVAREQGRPALHVTLDTLDGWDTLEPPTRAWEFPAGQTLTCFRARGTARTKQLALEWIEQDGSRWIATVDLKPEWQNYALPPEAFRPWQPPAGRGRNGDKLNLAKASRFTVGLALTHTALEPGAQEYWFADLGTAANPFGEAVPPPVPEIPRLESLSPAYQCYSITTPVAVRPPLWQAIIRESPSTNPPVAVPLPAGQRALHPRPRGVGCQQDRPWRWQPFLVARDAETDEFRGALGVLVVHDQAPCAGGVWALLTPGTPEFYRNPPVRAWLQKVLRRMREGVFLMEGGSEFFTLFPDQPARLGAKAANLGGQVLTNAEVMFTVLDQRTSRDLFRHRAPVRLEPRARLAVATDWNPTHWPAGGCVVATQLLVDGRVVDELYHELNRWQAKPEPAFLETRDGGFQIEGQPWRAHGVNYMPASGIGVASGYFEYWLGRGAYDPEVIERDLRRIQAMGLNAVSAFVYHRDLHAQHLLDFLFRCERLGLKVNLSLRPGTPMDFRWAEMKELIEYYRLAKNDTVIAYDLAWEPSHFDERYQRSHYTRAWSEWVLKQYGSIARAETAWGVPAPAPGGTEASVAASTSPDTGVPSMRQLTRDGPWRRLVADYRRFLDELVGAKYAEARRLVRSIDPHHPVSFRMQHAGDPTHLGEGLLPYDFTGLRDAVDIWEPEAYGRIGDWARVRAGGFTAAYARLCDPAKPVCWAEIGTSVWDLTSMAPSPAKLEFAARFYHDFYRMLIESGSDGVFFWWYPGGFRLFENSDFGIINPDGTDRTVTQVIREWGPKFLAAPRPPRPQVWIPVDRDRDARGLPGIYDAVKAQYWKAVDAGQPVGLNWAREPGATGPEPHPN